MTIIFKLFTSLAFSSIFQTKNIPYLQRKRVTNGHESQWITLLPLVQAWATSGPPSTLLWPASYIKKSYIDY